MADCKDDNTSAAENINKEGSSEKALFSPPLYSQRYSAVIELLEQECIKRVADVGCAECKFITLLTRVRLLEEVVGVDIDGKLLEDKKVRIRPLAAEYLKKREYPFRIRLFEGSVSEYDARLKDLDCIVMIEVIEHLYEDTLSAFPAVVFGKIQPALVIITTPNSEYNVLFPGFSGMRHDDHKFEWTRKEFQDWCENVCSTYPYNVEYSGVGSPPPDMDVGFCSQIGIFRRVAQSKEPNTSSETENQPEPYTLVAEEIYPFRPKPPREVVLADEAGYYLRRIQDRESKNLALKEYGDEEEDGSSEVMVKLEELMVFTGIQENCTSISDLRDVLKSTGTYRFTEDEEAVILDLGEDDEEEWSDGLHSDLDDHHSASEEDNNEEQEKEEVDENWDLDDNDSNENFIPYDVMWADAELETNHSRVSSLYQGRENINFAVREENDMAGDMVYVPSVLHAPEVLRALHSVSSEEGQFTDDCCSDSGKENLTEVFGQCRASQATDVCRKREVVKNFVIDSGQFDDVWEEDQEECVQKGLETLKIDLNETEKINDEREGKEVPVTCSSTSSEDVMER